LLFAYGLLKIIFYNFLENFSNKVVVDFVVVHKVPVRIVVDYLVVVHMAVVSLVLVHMVVAYK